MCESLLYYRKEVHLENITSHIIKPIIETIKKDIYPFFLKYFTKKLDILNALHNVWLPKVGLTPQSLKICKERLLV